MQETNKCYRQVIEESLPYLAQVVGGDVVLFDSTGMRLRACHPDGSRNLGVEGELTHLCGQVMAEIRPSIGPSALAPGSTAVRIPLCEEYGIALNNKLTAKQRNSLLDTARHYQYARYHLEDIIGESPAIAQAKKLTVEAAQSASTVLISGETGTGKELFAQAIHNLSARAAKPFVAINCGALPAELVESILFGYVEGAYTGAKKNGQPGAFEQANGGTLFLDEISEMPLPLQVKLLRVLQEHEVTRVGAAKPNRIDVRIIASTNKPLIELVKAGDFRADLFFRLNVVGIDIPPLRDRDGDLLALIDLFIQRFSIMMGKTVNEITPSAIRVLNNYNWPGNIRELQNAIEYAFNIIDVTTQSILPEHLPPAIRKRTETDSLPSLYAECMRKTEYNLVLKTMESCHYNKSEAAKRLGINRTTLWRILKRHKIEVLD